MSLYNFSGICPVCKEKMVITKLHCENCQTSLEGKFMISRISRLSEEQQAFIELFVKCRGNLKELGKELDLSYPTVRNRLDEVIKALGYAVESEILEEEMIETEKISILESIEKGKISVEEAIKKIKILTK